MNNQRRENSGDDDFGFKFEPMTNQMRIDEMKCLLEEAAAKIQLSPSNISPEDRHKYEKVIYDFYNSLYDFQTYVELLETTTDFDLKFHTIVALKNKIILTWSSLTNDTIVEALQFFMNKLSESNVPVYLTNAYLDMIAMLYKRLYIVNYAVCKQFSSVCFEMLNKTDRESLRLAYLLWRNIMGAFKCVNKTSDIGFKIECVYMAKSDFEKRELLFLFEICMRKLAQLKEATVEEIRSQKSIVDLLLQIFSWKFFPHTINFSSIIYEMEDDYSDLSPPIEWKSILFSNEFASIIWTAFLKFAQADDNMAFTLMTCFSRLAFLSGPIFKNRPEVAQYFENFLNCCFSMCTLDTLNNFLLIEFACLLNNMSIRNVPVQNMSPTAIDHYIKFTMKLAELLFENIKKCTDSNMEEEEILNGITLLMSTTMNLSVYTEFGTHENFRFLVLTLLKNYIDYRFPDRSANKDTCDEDVTISMDYEQDDRVNYESDLSYFGQLGQLFPFETVTSLLNLICDKIKMFCEILSAASVVNGLSDISPSHQVAEDLHWILLMSAYLLTQDFEEEYPTIPQSIMSLSVNINKKEENCERYLLNNGELDLDSILNSDLDIVIKFFSCVFYLVNVQEKAIRSNLYDFLSPQLATSLLWFLRRFFLCYFAFKGEFPIVSNVFSYLFGSSSHCLPQLIDSLLHKIIFDLEVWAGEETVVKEAANFLDRVSSNTVLCNIICKSKLFWEFGEIIACDTNLFKQLNIDYKAAFIKNFSAICFHSTNDAIKKNYANKLILPLSSKLNVIDCDGRQSFVYSEENMKNVIYTIITLTGVYEGCADTDFISQLTVTKTILKAIADVFLQYTVFHEAIFAILNLFNGMVKSCCYYMKQEGYAEVCQTFLNILNIIITHDVCQFRYPTSDDDCTKLYTLIFSILNSILSKEFLDLSVSTNSKSDPIEKIIEDTSLHSLTAILPCFSMDLLRCPDVYNAYFSYLDSLTQNHQVVIYRLNNDLFISVMDSVMFGFDYLGSSVISYAVRVLTHLCCFLAENRSELSEIHASKLESFIDHVLKQLFSSTRVVDFVESFADALFVLLRLFREHIEAQIKSTIIPLIHDDERVAICEKLESILQFSEHEFIRVNRRNFIDLVHSLIFQIHCNRKISL